MVDNNITYLCMADEEFGRIVPFSFLDGKTFFLAIFNLFTDIKNRFRATYGERGRTAVAFAMNQDFSRVMANLMVIFEFCRF